MDERERIERWNAKEDLIDEIKAVFGLEPGGVRKTLAILAHPDIIEHAIKYFRELDDGHVCVKYEHPYNCMNVQEASYESLTPHWIGSDRTIVVKGDWCDPCREQALNNP